MSNKCQVTSLKIVLPSDKYHELQTAAAHNGMSMAAYIRKATFEALRAESTQHPAAA